MYNIIFHALRKRGGLAKLLSLFAFLLLAGALPAHADETVRQQDPDGYYRLQTAEDLQWFADLVYDGNYKACGRLYADVNLATLPDACWRPIGGVQPGYTHIAHVFKGKFDGQNHVITGLKIRPFVETGLFGRTDSATIENVIVEKAALCDTVISLDYSKNSKNIYGQQMAVIVGNAQHTVVRNCHVRNALVTPVSLKGEQKWYMVGGICGSAGDECSVQDCSMSGYVMTNHEGAGGIVGYLENSEISNCSVLASENGVTKVSATNYVGGIVGYVKDANTDVTDCYVDQNAGRAEIHASEGNDYGTIWGKNANSKAEVAHTKYTEDDVVYEQTGRYVNTEEGRATETRVVGVKKKGKDYHVYADIGETYDYKTSVIDNMNGAATVDFWDNSSSKSAATACNWIDMEIADYAFDSSLKGLYMRYFMTAGTDHWIMLGPKDVRPKGKNMLAYAPEAKVYVDAEYYEAFITDSLWSAYKDRIVPVTSMRNTEKKQEGTYYAYDYNRDKAGTFLTKSPDGKHTVYQLHVVGGEDKSELRVYKDIGQDYDYNTTKIWASTFRGRQNLQTVRFSEIIEAAYHTYGPMQIALGDSCFADCPKLGHFEVILYSNEGDDHVEYIHPSEMPIGKGVFANSPNVKIFVARELVDEFKNDTVYGWATSATTTSTARACGTPTTPLPTVRRSTPTPTTTRWRRCSRPGRQTTATSRP